ncbi:M23 family metallopeptidase [Gemmobacter fulvus]|uniref:M23 family metallopeptidase n=1 Tax=Gemmobacter fulvus TaxID=2840474 RepID=UPI00279653A5|nr:M23 family metallopeptidase [Gemmobacter fulvus]MDQ1847634.1 M23 family metallopeptidase [Gemmobacter fulvus]
MIRALTVCLLAPASAGAFDLALPIDCRLGETCFIQQYMDHDPGAGARDFTCGTLSYDTHEGTDFALPSHAAMQAGVNVLAAAAGQVRGIRDGMPDILVSDPAALPLEGRDCGNGVAIRHADGWETQYCHLKQGSVAVQNGQTVLPGTVLGQVGLSGRTEFPHLHVTLRRDGKTVDPFAPEGTTACGQVGDSLWQEGIPYQPGGLIALGFSPDLPDFASIKAGPPDAPLPADAPALVLWAYLYGGVAGDVLRLTIHGPQGAVLAEDIVLERTQAQLFRSVGKRLRQARWPAGEYTGEVILRREDREIDRGTLRMTLP